MSQWPPPPRPSAPPPDPAPVFVRSAPGQRGGCGRAVTVTVLMAALVVFAIMLLGSQREGITPVLENSIGVIRIEGTITDSGDTVKLLRRFRKNKMIKALVVRVDSPGGGVAASEEIYRELLKTRREAKIPVIVSMGSVAASGGYYIAAASERIFATSGTITGSIGVIAPMFNAKETLEKLGVRENSIVSGEHKATGDPFRDQSVTDRALLQGMVYDMYRQFFQVVLAARHEQIGKAQARGDVAAVIDASATKSTTDSLELAAFPAGAVAQALKVSPESEAALRQLADGRVFTGEQALRVGLVDEIGTLQDAVDYAGKLADLGDDPPTVDRTPGERRSSWLAKALGQALQQALETRHKVEFRAPF